MKEETRQVFEIFVETVERIRSYRFEDHVREVGLKFSSAKREDGLWDCSFGLPDEKEQGAFVLVFRMFIQQNDEVCILNLNRFTSDPGVSKEWKEGYGEVRKIYLKYLREKPELFEDNVFEGSPTRGEILDTILYGYLVHVPRDHPEKREQYKKWTKDDFWEGILYQQFTRILLCVLSIIYRLGALCQSELDKNNAPAI